MEGKPIKVFNYGRMVRDFTYVDDIVEGVIRAIEKHLGKKAEKEYLPMQPGDVPRTEADVTDLVRDMDYKPSTTVEEGIGRFIEWYRGYYHGIG